MADATERNGGAFASAKGRAACGEGVMKQHISVEITVEEGEREADVTRWKKLDALQWFPAAGVVQTVGSTARTSSGHTQSIDAYEK